MHQSRTLINSLINRLHIGTRVNHNQLNVAVGIGIGIIGIIGIGIGIIGIGIIGIGIIGIGNHISNHRCWHW